MRLFVAIPLSDEMKDALIAAQDAMYERGVRGNYTPEENMHLTLAFIGEYPDAEPVLDALAGVSFRPFEIALDSMGCFGSLWWAGLRESAPLEAVVHRVRRALAAKEIPFDRKRFFPHVTLIRKARGRMPGFTLEPAAMTVRSLSLLRSDRGRNGMLYTELGVQEGSP